MTHRLRKLNPDDEELARAAVAKTNNGQTPTVKEAAALRRMKTARDEALRWEHYKTIPQKHMLELSGRPAKVLREQQQTHGIAGGGAVVDLSAYIRSVCDFLARNKGKLATGGTDDPMMQGGDSPNLERYRAAKASLVEMDLEERRKTHCRISDIEQGLTIIFSALRDTLAQIEREHGRAAGDLLRNSIDEAMLCCAKMFGGLSDTPPVAPATPPALPPTPATIPPAEPPSEPTPCG